MHKIIVTNLQFDLNFLFYYLYLDTHPDTLKITYSQRRWHSFSCIKTKGRQC